MCRPRSPPLRTRNAISAFPRSSNPRTLRYVPTKWPNTRRVLVGLQTRARRHRLHVTAGLARSKSFASIELLRHPSQVYQYIAFTPGHFVQLGVAPLAVPDVAFRLIGTSDWFHH